MLPPPKNYFLEPSYMWEREKKRKGKGKARKGRQGEARQGKRKGKGKGKDIFYKSIFSPPLSQQVIACSS